MQADVCRRVLNSVKDGKSVRPNGTALQPPSIAPTPSQSVPSEPNGAISVGCKREFYRPSPHGRTLRTRESAAHNDRDTARNVRRSAAHKGQQLVRHPNARLHDLWRERGAVDRVEHVADERP